MQCEMNEDTYEMDVSVANAGILDRNHHVILGHGTTGDGSGR